MSIYPGAVKPRPLRTLYSANTAGAVFDMSHFGIWDRVLYPEEMQAVREVWNAKGDIQA